MKKVYFILIAIFISSCAGTKQQKNLAAKYPKQSKVYLMQLLQGEVVSGTIDGYDADGKLRVLVASPYFNVDGKLCFNVAHPTPMHLDTGDVVLVSEIR